MGHSSTQRRVAKSIYKWGCLGYWGYGQGRAVSEFGEKWFKDLSVCQDLCPQGKRCQQGHHLRMDRRYPEIADLVHRTARHASKMKLPIVRSVIGAMNVAHSQKVAGTEEIRAILSEFRVAEMTDHYVCGQFQNIQNGMDSKAPDFQRSIPVELYVAPTEKQPDGEAG